jgi:hypothetical protein
MVEAIKKIVQAQGNTTPPCTFIFGTVVADEPLVVQVDSRFIIGREALVVMRSNAALSVGDRLVLLREHGGQRFLVLGVVE